MTCGGRSVLPTLGYYRVLERFGVQGEINAVHVLTAQRRIHDDGRERMFDGIAGDSVDASGGVHLIDAVDAAQIERADLTRCSFEIGAHCAKGEGAAGAHAEHAADDALLSHAQPDQCMLAALRLQKLHHGHVVRERSGGRDDFVKVGGDFQHFLQRLIEVARATKIMERQDESGAAAQARNRFRLRLQRALPFQVDNLTTCGMGLGEHFQLRSQRSFELAAIVGAAAGPYGSDVLVRLQKTMQFGKHGQGLLQVIQTELDEGVIPGHGLGGSEHVFGGVTAQRQTDLGQARREETGRDGGRQGQGHLFSTTARYYRGGSADATYCRSDREKHFWTKGLNTLVTLTLPWALVTFWL